MVIFTLRTLHRSAVSELRSLLGRLNAVGRRSCPHRHRIRTGLCYCPNIAGAGVTRRKSLRGESEPAPLPLYGQSDQVSLNAAGNRPERTCVRPPLERYCWSISGAEGAPRSCPAGSIAEVGLRWCGATPRNPNGGSRCQSLRRSDRRRQRQPPFQLQNHRDTVLAILSLRGPIAARSNRASSRCCDHPRGQRLKR